jgi:glutathione synthase/RimK-type ligase-like ATP-grasp enzyme
MAALVGLAYRQGNVGGIWSRLLERFAGDPEDAAALMDMSVILQTAGQREKGLELQRKALQLRRCYRRQHGRGDGLKVLAFVAEGDFMANTPIDFLMQGSDAILSFYHVDSQTRNLRDVPEHDVAFVAVGESEANVPVLVNLERLLEGWHGPVMNAPRRILALKRDTVAGMFAGEASIYAPPSVRLDRGALQQLAHGDLARGAVLPGWNFPVIVRPFDSHAGEGLEKMAGPGDVAAYLNKHPEQQFCAAPFIDYAGADKLYRKQRVAIIDGQPFAGHWATSKHWMVHYLNAGMQDNEAWRAEEAAWMRDFDSDFAVRHASAFQALYEKLGLDYFVIDCAEMPDGRLLLFEAHVAMILHDMDPVEVYPYKQPAMKKLFSAFQAALQRRRRHSLQARAGNGARD